MEYGARAGPHGPPRAAATEPVRARRSGQASPPADHVVRSLRRGGIPGRLRARIPMTRTGGAGGFEGGGHVRTGAVSSVRDRGPLRSEHLQRLGWRFHRIWSTNWFRDPQAEVAQADRGFARGSSETVLPGRKQPAEGAEHPQPGGGRRDVLPPVRGRAWKPQRGPTPTPRACPASDE